MADKPTGFRLPERTAVISFEGTEYDGAEVRCRYGVTLETFMRLSRALKSGAEEDAAQAIQEFGGLVKDWNLEDEDGKPIPCDREHWSALPLDFLLLVMGQWLNSVGGVPAPLAEPSGNGSTSAGESTTPPGVSLSPPTS